MATQPRSDITMQMRRPRDSRILQTWYGPGKARETVVKFPDVRAATRRLAARNLGSGGSAG
jgi:hypothetical protein